MVGTGSDGPRQFCIEKWGGPDSLPRSHTWSVPRAPAWQDARSRDLFCAARGGGGRRVGPQLQPHRLAALRQLRGHGQEGARRRRANVGLWRPIGASRDDDPGSAPPSAVRPRTRLPVYGYRTFSFFGRSFADAARRAIRRCASRCWGGGGRTRSVALKGGENVHLPTLYRVGSALLRAGWLGRCAGRFGLDVPHRALRGGVLFEHVQHGLCAARLGVAVVLERLAHLGRQVLRRVRPPAHTNTHARTLPPCQDGWARRAPTAASGAP